MHKITSDIINGKNIRQAIFEESSLNSYTFAVIGYYSTYARTQQEAKYNVMDEDFGDLYDVNYSVESSEDTMDGKRNDMVHVTFEISGLLDIKSSSESEAQKLANEADVGELEDVEYRLTNF